MKSSINLNFQRQFANSPYSFDIPPIPKSLVNRIGDPKHKRDSRIHNGVSSVDHSAIQKNQHGGGQHTHETKSDISVDTKMRNARSMVSKDKETPQFGNGDVKSSNNAFQSPRHQVNYKISGFQKVGENKSLKMRNKKNINQPNNKYSSQQQTMRQVKYVDKRTINEPQYNMGNQDYIQQQSPTNKSNKSNNKGNPLALNVVSPKNHHRGIQPNTHKNMEYRIQYPQMQARNEIESGAQHSGTFTPAFFNDASGHNTNSIEIEEQRDQILEQEVPIEAHKLYHIQQHSSKVSLKSGKSANQLTHQASRAKQNNIHNQSADESSVTTIKFREGRRTQIHDTYRLNNLQPAPKYGHTGKNQSGLKQNPSKNIKTLQNSHSHRKMSDAISGERNGKRYDPRNMNIQSNKSTLNNTIDQTRRDELIINRQGSKSVLSQLNTIQQNFENMKSGSLPKVASKRGTNFQQSRVGSISRDRKSRMLAADTEVGGTIAGKKRFQVDDFQVIKLLGRGSFGKVKLVYHARTSSFFAIKCLAKENIRGKKQIQHIMNEKEILKKFSPQDFCCNMIDTLQDSLCLYLVIDYLPGGELFSLLKQQVFMSEDHSRFYIAEIIVAVETLHSMGIIYRDLKPENILIDKNGHIKLIDFGFAKQIKNIHQDRAYTNCGTPGYCAPEVMLDAGHTYKADIWSIGILICEMIGGYTPFQSKHEASNPRAIMEKCRSGKLNLPKNLKGNARDLVNQLLTDDPVTRLEISQIKEHQFFKGLDWYNLKKRLVQPPYVPEYEAQFPDIADTKVSRLDDDNSEGSPVHSPKKPGETNSLLPFINSELHSPEIKKGSKKQKNLSNIPEFEGMGPNRQTPLGQMLTPLNNSHLYNQNNLSQQLDAQQFLKHNQSNEQSVYSSKNYSSTGGTGGYNSRIANNSSSNRKYMKSPATKVLGDFQMTMINKAFADF